MQEAAENMFGMAIAVWMVQAVVFAILGFKVGASRGDAGKGLVIGAILGPLGLILTAFVFDWRPKCPQCRSGVPDEATRCPGCGCSLVVEAVEPDKPVIDQVDLECEACGEVNSTTSEQVGKKLVCEYCGELNVVPGRKKSTLKACPDCGEKISRRASACPHCGCPAC